MLAGKVLVIENDVKTAATLQSGLEAVGCRVEVAYDGHDGLWLATETGAIGGDIAESHQAPVDITDSPIGGARSVVTFS